MEGTRILEAGKCGEGRRWLWCSKYARTVKGASVWILLGLGPWLSAPRGVGCGGINVSSGVWDARRHLNWDSEISRRSCEGVQVLRPSHAKTMRACSKPPQHTSYGSSRNFFRSLVTIDSIDAVRRHYRPYDGTYPYTLSSLGCHQSLQD